MVGQTVRLRNTKSQHRNDANNSTTTALSNAVDVVDSNQRELEISRLQVLIDTCQVSLTSMLVKEDTEHTLRLKALTREADEAEHAAQIARNEIARSRTHRDAKTHRYETVLKEINSLKQRAAAHQAVVDAHNAELSTTPAQSSTEPTQPGPSPSQHASGLGLSDDTMGPSSASLDDIEKWEGQVVALREVHADLYNQVRSTKLEIESLKANLGVLQDQRKSLQQKELQLLATETNNCYDEARALKKRHTDLLKELRRQEEDILAATAEKQSMLRHLTDGAMSRCNNLNDYRRSFQARAAPHEQSFLTQLLADNKSAREDAFNIFLSSEQEMDALRQYETVLKQRLDDAAQRLHTLAFNAELNNGAAVRGQSPVSPQ